MRVSGRARVGRRSARERALLAVGHACGAVRSACAPPARAAARRGRRSRWLQPRGGRCRTLLAKQRRRPVASALLVVDRVARARRRARACTLPVRANSVAWLTVAVAAVQGRRRSAPAASSKLRAIHGRGSSSHARNTAAFSAMSASSGGGASNRPSCAHARSAASARACSRPRGYRRQSPQLPSRRDEAYQVALVSQAYQQNGIICSAPDREGRTTAVAWAWPPRHHARKCTGSGEPWSRQARPPRREA